MYNLTVRQLHLHCMMAGELPTFNKEYGDKSYWDTRFAKEETFDWFHPYETFRELIRHHVPTTSRILMIGCGNSKLSEDMYADGYHNIVNTDYSGILIEKMGARCASLEGMSWHVMDMRDIAFPTGSFDCVIEKGTLDVFMVDQNDVWRPDQLAKDNMHRTLEHVSRVLRDGGVFVSITFAQPHFRLPFLSQQRYGWSVAVNEFGESFHFYLYACVKGGRCDDLRAQLDRPLPASASAFAAESSDPDEFFGSICPDT